MIEVTSEGQLLTMVNENGPENLFILKHSTQCPVSAAAFDEFKQFAETHPEIVCAFIDILSNRPVSNLLEKISKIQHESPQVIQFARGGVQWTASHNAIDCNALEIHIHPSS